MTDTQLIGPVPETTPAGSTLSARSHMPENGFPADPAEQPTLAASDALPTL
jgi:hypothetical protein